MRFHVLTLFPDMFAPMRASIFGRALDAGILALAVFDIRAYSTDKHRRADDYPFGGGAGMVMTCQPIADCMAAATAPPFPEGGRRVFLGPRGTPLTQRVAERLAGYPALALLCGHYEGVDQRVLDACVEEEISVGDYILTGGELPAMVLMDCVARLLPGVLGCGASGGEESFTGNGGLLEYPQYTHPRRALDADVPDVLFSGDHARIAAWRRSESLRVTFERRPDLLDKATLTAKERALVASWRGTLQEP